MRGQIVGTGAEQTWRRITSAPVGNTPLGAVYAIWSNTVPGGFLPCNGAQFDRAQYPFLYSLLGTDYLPDLRECALVGIGQNGTDDLTTHDIYTLGQFKDFSTAGSGAIKTAGYTVSGNNVVLNTTVNAENRKLVTQYVADASATDLQTLDIGGDSVTRMRSKGVNYIIKAIPGNEVCDYNFVIDQMEAQLALKISLEYVNALPEGDSIEDNIYGYQGHYYIGDHENATLTQLVDNSDLTTLQPKTLDTSLTIGGSTITTVEDALDALNTVKLEKGIKDVDALPVDPDIEDLVYRYNGGIYFGDSTNQTITLLDAEAIVMVDEGDPLPTGADIKSKLYVQSETIGSSTKYHYYVGDTTVTPHVLIEMSTGGSDIFVGTQAEWNALSAAEQAQYAQADITDVNSVVHVPVDTVADGNMNPPTSNAVYGALYPSYTSATLIYNKSKDHTKESESWNMTETVTIQSTGWYRLLTTVLNVSLGVATNSISAQIGSVEVSRVSQISGAGWTTDTDNVVVPIKKDTVITIIYNLPAGMRGDVIIQKID